jgi:hypothetical protein
MVGWSTGGWPEHKGLATLQGEWSGVQGGGGVDGWLELGRE